jgi:hypothetical protein
MTLMNIQFILLGVRTFAYMLFVAGLVYLITLEGYREGTSSEYSEQSLTEWLESGCALLSGACFLLAARFNAAMRPAAVMLASLCLMTFIREADFFLDEWVFDGSWQALIFVVLAVTAIYLWRQPGSIAQSVNRYASEPSAGVFLGGFLVLLVFSRLFGRGSFWQAVMGDGYMRVVKNIAEEGTEIMGYGLIAIAAMELLYVTLSHRARLAKSKPGA